MAAPARSRLQRNDNFFKQQANSDSAGKIRRAYERCAECGVLNLSGQNLSGQLPEAVCGFQEASWAERWWEQCPVAKVDVSHNTLEGIPPEIGRLSDCQSFLAFSNQLQAVPEELFSALPLKQLNLRANQLTALPGRAVAQAELLVELILSENKLSQLPQEVFSLQNLEVLELGSNLLSSLHDVQGAAWACTKLKRLDLAGNHLSKLPWALRRCPSLRELLAARNALEDMGDFLVLDPGHGWRKSLLLVDLASNRLGPRLKVSGLDSLDNLTLSANRLTHLDLVGPLPRLSSLIAEGNKIVSYPEALLPDSAPMLNTLDLSNNDLANIPPELGLSQCLKRILLGGNPIRSIRPELLRGGAEALKKFLRSRLSGPNSEEPESPADAGALFANELRTAAATRELDLSGQNLSMLPALPSGLRLLAVGGNQLSVSALQASLGLEMGAEGEHLGDSLCILRAERNSLGSSGNSGSADGFPGAVVPDLLRCLPSLQELDLRFNRLAELGRDMNWSHVQISSVTFMDLSGNLLTELPGRLLATCPQLQELRLRQNRLCSLSTAACPGVPGHCLSTLDLEENNLTDLPPWLPAALPRLRSLLLANNNISPSLPPEHGFWESLQGVTLAGNPLKAMRQALVARGWAAVSAWLRDRLPEGAPRSLPVPEWLERSEWEGVAATCQTERSRGNASSARGGSYGSSNPVPPSPSLSVASGGSHTAPRRAEVSSAISRPTSGSGDLDSRMAKAREAISSLEEELAQPGLGRQRHSTLSHSLRMKRAELLKAEREMRRAQAAEQQECS